MEEIWKDIDGYIGLYQVSNFGNIKSLNYKRTNKPKIMINTIDSRGYYNIILRINNIGKTYLVHRLVANAFIPNIENYPQINHKDENKLNNHINNLEWCTASYNRTYGTNPERHDSKLRKPIAMTDIKTGIITEFDSTTSALKFLNKKIGGNINKCCIGKKKSLYGYTWKYL